MNAVWIQLLLVALVSSLKEVEWSAFENGALGRYPQKEFYSAPNISQPLVHVEKYGACDETAYVLLCPDGARVPGNKAIILDQNGELVWFQKELGTVKSLQVQRFKGREFLTYWVGDDEFFGHGHGYYKMLDQSYSLAYAISALNGLDGDYHDFTITPQNTALFTIYEKKKWDLTSLGRSGDTGWIWDCLFQEIDIEKNEVVFQWRASEHFTFEDMSVNSWEEDVGYEKNPWDWFHLNSVQKDAWGNYLIAARYTNAVSYIEGFTGRPLWHLGGIRNTFSDLTSGNATAFVDPHMARWEDSYTAITVFDNVNFRLKQESGAIQSHGMKVWIDRQRQQVIRTVDFVHPAEFFAMAEGSMQRLNSGNYFIGYGSASVYSEFAPNGTLMCTANYSPTNASIDVEARHGTVQSYRIFKQQWSGQPKSLPNTKVSKGKLYVSWNGATEVSSWELIGEGAIDDATSSAVQMGVFPKTGFETVIQLQGGMHSSYRLIALARDGSFIRSFSLHPDGHIWEIFFHPVMADTSTNWSLLLFFVGCTVLLFGLNRKVLASRVQVSRARRSSVKSVYETALQV